MQWVDGHTLNKYVEDLVEQQDTPRAAAFWRRRGCELVASAADGPSSRTATCSTATSWSTRAGEMRLVDFDCSWIGRFAGRAGALARPGTGTTNCRRRAWGRWMDTFPGLVIYTSLLALSKNPNPWHALNTGENLLFRHEDFHPPFQSPTWAHLSNIQDRQLDLLAVRLKECCAPGWVPNGRLEELLGPRQIPWWQRTPAAAAPAAAPRQLPQPIPTGWPNIRPAPNWQPVRQPTRNWWQEQAAQGNRGPQVPVPRRTKPSVGVVVAAALGWGSAAAILCAAVAASAGGEGGAGALVGLLVAIIVFIVGMARRSR